MKKVFLVLCPLIATLLVGQQASIADLEEIDVSYDEFEEFTLTSINCWHIKLAGTYGSFCLEPRQVKKGSSTYYWLCLKYSGDEWFFIKEGKSLVFLADGEKITLSVDYGNIDRDYGVSGGDVWISEWAPYSITPYQLKKLAYSKEVKVRIYGDHYTDGYFTEDNSQKLRLFYEAVIQGKWKAILEARRKAQEEEHERIRIEAEKQRREDSLYIQAVLQALDTASLDVINNAIERSLNYRGWYQGWIAPYKLESRVEELEKRKVREKDSLFVQNIVQQTDNEPPGDIYYSDIRLAIVKCKKYEWSRELKKLEAYWKKIK